MDGEYLDQTLVVVAASRVGTTPFRMKGATLFVDRDSGKAERINNDGLDGVQLALDDGRLGFVDESHDYLLGTERPVRERKRIDGQPYGTYWLDGTLVTAFNGGFGEEFYELAVSESGESTELRLESGFVESMAQCEDGVWMIRNSDFESVDMSSTLVVDRLAPRSNQTWSVKARRGMLELHDLSCSGKRLVALGSTSIGDHDTGVVADINLTTGESTVLPLKGLKPKQNPAEAYHFWTPALREDGLYVVSSPGDGVTEAPHELLRIDPTTGKVEHIVAIEDEADRGMEVRIQDDHLYVLDVTREIDSRLRAYRLTDGKLVGTRTFDPLDRRLNGRFVDFDTQLIVFDFAVTTPVEDW